MIYLFHKLTFYINKYEIRENTSIRIIFVKDSIEIVKFMNRKPLKKFYVSISVILMTDLWFVKVDTIVYLTGLFNYETILKSLLLISGEIRTHEKRFTDHENPDSIIGNYSLQFGINEILAFNTFHTFSFLYFHNFIHYHESITSLLSNLPFPVQLSFSSMWQLNNI